MIRRIVDTNFWTDAQVIDNYSVEDKFFALYLMTNDKSTQVGIYSLPKRVISFETGFTTEIVQVLLDRFSQQYGKIIYSNETQEVTVLNSLEYSILKGGKPVLDLLQRELIKIKDGSLILKTYETMLEFWTLSKRQIDKNIQTLFENELKNRKLWPEEELAVDENKEETWLDSILVTDSSTDSIKTIHDENELSRYMTYIEKEDASLKDKVTKENILYHFYQVVFGEPTEKIKDDLRQWTETFSKAIIIEALLRSKEAFKPMSYANTILMNWKNSNVETLKDIKDLDKIY